jgi:hypothetical protein
MARPERAQPSLMKNPMAKCYCLPECDIVKDEFLMNFALKLPTFVATLNLDALEIEMGWRQCGRLPRFDHFDGDGFEGNRCIHGRQVVPGDQPRPHGGGGDVEGSHRGGKFPSPFQPTL